MFKKKTLWFGLIAIIVLAIVYLSGLKMLGSGREVIVESKVPYYEDASSIEKEATAILLVDKISEDEPFIKYDDRNNPIYGYSISNVKVISVVKNETGNSVAQNDVISILENEYTDKNTKITYHLEGYMKMKNENEYLLFLFYTPENGLYVPVGGVFGKVNTDKSEKILFDKEDSLYSSYMIINNELREIYKDIL